MFPEQTILNNKYRIVRMIGEGAAARVWLAVEPRFGDRMVAIKELRRDLLTPSDLEEQERRFYQEVRLAALLEQADAPHVVRAITVEETADGARLLVMVYADGGSLADLIMAHPTGLPIDQAVRIAIQVCETLEVVHNLPVEAVHRDVKPSNILLTNQGEALLSDFGLVQLAGMSGRSHLSGGQHPGTPIYMAPEQERGGGYLTPAADIFALGCVLFEMLTSQRYKRHKPGTLPSQLRPEVPTWLDEAVAKALVEDPWQRWQSAEAMAKALSVAKVKQDPAQSAAATSRQAETRAGVTPTARPVTTGVQTSAGSPPAQGGKRGARRFSWLGWVAGAVGLMATAVLIAWVLRGAASINGTHVPAQSPEVVDAPVTWTATAAPEVMATGTSHISETMGTAIPIATDTSTPTPLPPTNTPSITPSVTPTPTSTSTWTPSPTPLPAAVVKSPTVNMRSGPSTVYEIVGEYPKDTYLEIVGKNEAETWLQVQAPDAKMGWVTADLLQVNLPLTSTQVIVVPSPTPRPTSTGPVISPTNLRVSTAPSECDESGRCQQLRVSWNDNADNEQGSVLRVHAPGEHSYWFLKPNVASWTVPFPKCKPGDVIDFTLWSYKNCRASDFRGCCPECDPPPADFTSSLSLNGFVCP